MPQQQGSYLLAVRLLQLRIVKAAYEVLCDSRLRKQYDNLGLLALGAQYADLLGYMGGPGLGAGAAGHARGGAGGGVGGVRGRDVHLVLGLLLSEAAQGAEKVVTYEAMGACEACQGSGLASLPEACSCCGGTGSVMRSEWAGAAERGSFSGVKVAAPAPCPACGGWGALPQPPCQRCSGRGRRRVLRELSLRVPAGVERGATLRVAGEGGAGRYGGHPGDLLVRLEVYPDSNLSRVGDDLHSELEVEVWVAVLGGSVAVDTVRGQRLLEVPPGAEQGDVLRLSGAGVARAAPGGGGLVRGDHVFTLRLRLPSAAQLCDPSRALLRRLAACDSTLRGAAAGALTGAATS
ncbi:hypothetical protein GPECTOR_56g346 [Gonium pectorale]|uniref:CR-type domain-containing protein n=1 Tax=Gonium pectorale TaxID=33097 RepID=A0A150G7C9_GONPE|nr:hypothetical protein GPECTOR_56g346 [Gonium pectorale]|eukprot:KXZ45250.1 hypothetical protein GPECTOR_56g346 [Gonium pectorale]